MAAWVMYRVMRASALDRRDPLPGAHGSVPREVRAVRRTKKNSVIERSAAYMPLLVAWRATQIRSNIPAGLAPHASLACMWFDSVHLDGPRASSIYLLMTDTQLDPSSLASHATENNILSSHEILP
jgi:hypothetical protein